MSKGQYGSWSLHQQRLEIVPPGEMRTRQHCHFPEPMRRVQLPQCQEKGLHFQLVSVIRSFSHNWRGDLSVAEINCIICQLCLCSPARSVCVITCYDYVWTSKWEQRRLNSIKFPWRWGVWLSSNTKLLFVITKQTGLHCKIHFLLYAAIRYVWKHCFRKMKRRPEWLESRQRRGLPTQMGDTGRDYTTGLWLNP